LLLPATLSCNDSRRGKQESRGQGELLPALQGKGVVADSPADPGGSSFHKAEGVKEAVTFISR